MELFSTLRWIISADQRRKAEFVKRSDGTYGFQEWKFLEQEQAWSITRIGAGSRCASMEDAIREAKGRIDWLTSELKEPRWYQVGWSTLPGLRGLSCSEFRATPTTAPDDERGVVIELVDDAERDAFVKQAEEFFAPRRFTNAADAFDTVKAYVLERAAKRP